MDPNHVLYTVLAAIGVGLSGVGVFLAGLVNSAWKELLIPARDRFFSFLAKIEGIIERQGQDISTLKTDVSAIKTDVEELKRDHDAA